jgi:hydrogenase expression/formation protein HypD
VDGNQYARGVRTAGNEPAQAMLREVFEVVPRAWRGIGAIPASGLGLRAGYADWDAERKFNVSAVGGCEDAECQSGQVLRGLLKPPECPRLWHPLHAGDATWGDEGVFRGSLCRLFHYRRFIGPCAPASP